MNYLAHLYLSGNNEQLLIGNFIADAIKGSDVVKYPAGIQQGIQLHRAIDDFTDTHPVVAESKNLIRDHYRKYAGVVVDIYYDYFLAKAWDSFSDITLPLFSKNVVQVLKNNHDLLPRDSQRFLQYAVMNNILERYAEKEGIAKVFYGMSRRASFNSGMEKAVNHLTQFETELNAHFLEFFPQLQIFVKNRGLKG